LARQYAVHLHTHLAETEDEEQFCIEKFGYRPVAYMQELGWMGKDVWFAHAIWVGAAEISVFAQHRCGVAHCPTSNMRLASGIAPVKGYVEAGVNVGLGVDGSASNDGSHLLAEVRQAMLLARAQEGITGFSRSNDPERRLMTARQALWIGTRGGAAVLGRDDLGSLEPGKCADFFAVKLGRLEYAGATHDPVSALVFCQPRRVDCTAVGGRWVVRDRQLVTLDEAQLIHRHNNLSRSLLEM
jgi:8-oxoguanine deaminase